jgi:hypothetical protein
MNHATTHGELKPIQTMFFCVEKRSFAFHLYSPFIES